MSHRLGFNGYATADAAPVSTSSVIPSPGESGVYDNYSNRVAQTLPRRWREDDDEERTSVHSPHPERRHGTLLPPQPLQSRRAPLWQVALQLRGDELSRLWRRNANHLAGRIFVWSEHSSQWIQLHSSTDALPGLDAQIFLPPQTSDSALGTARSRSLSRPASGEPVDLTRDARPQLLRLPLRMTRGWAVGLAASLFTVVAVAALLPGKPPVINTVAPPPVTVQPRTSEPKVNVPSATDIVAVESLPLVSTPPRRAEQLQLAGSGATSNSVANAPGSVATTAFKPAVARQALSRAASHAGHCSSGEFSGSVQVTYHPSGAVSDVALSALAGEVSGSACIVNSFRAARIAPFQGNPVTVRKSFSSRG